MHRRTFLRFAFSMSATHLAASPVAQTPPALRSIAAPKGLLVGSAVSYRELQDPDFTEMLAAQASIVVSENDFKWQTIHPSPDRFDFVRADALLKFANDNDQKLRGHNLCWHNQMPSWFADVATAENAGDLLQQHIRKVAGHFAGHIHSWDVVNEAVNVQDGRPDGLRNSQWLQLLGPEYIDIAFRTAAETDPKALLTYNDYDLEEDGAKFDAKRKAVLSLLTGMRRRNVPIHALGLQSHLKASPKLPDWSALQEFILAVEKLDLDLFVTELDVNDSALTGDVEERDQLVAGLYQDYLKNVLQHRSVKAVLTWGLTDRDSWLNSPRLRHDERLRRPLPLDSTLQPKPAFYAMETAIIQAPARS